MGEIVVIDRAPHPTSGAVADCEIVVPAEPGYGAALLAGFAATSAPYVITIDPDELPSLSPIRALWERRDDAEVLVASCLTSDGPGRTEPRRRFSRSLLDRLRAHLLGLPVHDLSSGYRLYHRRAIAGLTLHAHDAHARAEILIRVHGEGWTIREIHVEDLGHPPGQPRRRLDSPVALLRLWRLRNSVLAADYDARAFDSAIWFQRHWQRTRHRIVMDMLEGRDAILDVGCGSGRIILDLPDAVGLDILHRKLRWLRPRHRLLVCGSADRLPFPDASFSTVVCSEVIEHIPDRPEVLGEMTRVLRPGGLLILGTPDYGRRLWRALEWAYGKVLPDAYADEHITHFTRQSLAQRLRGAGYEILDCRYLMSSVVIFKARKPAPVLVHTNGVAAHPHDAAAPPRVAAPGH
jgi:ubiquinone/menaquinone biosynthesis C-methylase UbiE